MFSFSVGTSSIEPSGKFDVPMCPPGVDACTGKTPGFEKVVVAISLVEGWAYPTLEVVVDVLFDKTAEE